MKYRIAAFVIFAVIVAYSCKQPTKTAETTRLMAEPLALLTDSGGSEKFFAHRWVLVEVDGRVISPAGDEKEAHLLFFPGQVSRVSGSTSCNKLNGTFELSGVNKIKFSPLATTKMMCAPDNNTEQQFLKALEKANNYYFTGDHLMLLNGRILTAKLKAAPANSSKNNGNKQTTSAADVYINQKEKFDAGVDFTASGNEPFWSVEIDSNQLISFKTPAGIAIKTAAVTPIRLMDVAASSYRMQTQNGLLNVVIYDKPCVNDMSGDTLPKMVEVSLDEKRYSGCGRFLADYRLHDIWVLKSINDKAIDGKSLQKGAPILEIYLAEGRVAGHSGCNGFGGPLQVKGRTISFPRLTGTMMACDDGGFETRYLADLSPKEMKYKVDNGILTLQNGKLVLTYRKVD